MADRERAYPREDVMIQFTCECGRRLQALESSAGRQVGCPACGQQQLVPAVGAEAIQPAGPEQVQSQRPPRLPEETSAEAPVKTSGKAIASLVLGLSSL